MRSHKSNIETSLSVLRARYISHRIPSSLLRNPFLPFLRGIMQTLDVGPVVALIRICGRNGMEEVRRRRQQPDFKYPNIAGLPLNHSPSLRVANHKNFKHRPKLGAIAQLGDVSKGAACSKMATAKLGWVGDIDWAIAPNFRGDVRNFLWFATQIDSEEPQKISKPAISPRHSLRHRARGRKSPSRTPKRLRRRLREL